MVDGVSVEAASRADLETLVEQWVVLVASQRSFGTHLESESNREAARDVLGQYLAGERVLVARPDPEYDGPAAGLPILGFAMFYRETGLYEQDVHRGVVENLYVEPAARRLGIGTALLEAAERELADRGATVVALSVMAANEGGRAFYRAHGYETHRVTLQRALDDTGD